MQSPSSRRQKGVPAIPPISGYNDEMGFDFSGKIAVVTGGANGIGAATARVLAQGGPGVAIFDLERRDPAAAAAQLGGAGYAVDVTDRASLERAFDQIGAPDIVIANAGIGEEVEFGATAEETWQRTIAVNLTGVFLTLQAAAERMKPRQRGAMVLPHPPTHTMAKRSSQ